MRNCWYYFDLHASSINYFYDIKNNNTLSPPASFTRWYFPSPSSSASLTFFFRVLLPPTLNRPRSGYFCFRESVQKNLNAWTIRVISAYIYNNIYIFILTVIIEEHRNLNSRIAGHGTRYLRAAFDVQVVHFVLGTCTNKNNSNKKKFIRLNMLKNKCISYKTFILYKEL